MYQDLEEENLILLGRRWMFQQDSDSKRSAKVTQEGETGSPSEGHMQPWGTEDSFQEEWA